MTVLVNERRELPRIAVSVGMLDTGFDCPGVVNIVFCRPTGSEILYNDSVMIATTVTNAKE